MKDTEPRPIRFTNDQNVTFINYGTDVSGGLSYRQEARLHNAGRRQQNLSGVSRSRDEPVVQEGALSLVRTQHAQPTSLTDPVSTFGRDPFCRTIGIPPSVIEQAWRSVFPTYFYLPQLASRHPGVPDPAEYFLSTAKSGQDLYRSLVLQAVITSETEGGYQNQGDAIQNQAMIIRDVRRLNELNNTPRVRLTSRQFEQIYASVFSLIGHGFDREAGYNAIVFSNCLLMAVPHNQVVAQTPVSEWIRMLMPRPGPFFYRSEDFRREMVRKINLVLDFLHSVQTNVELPFADQVMYHLRPTTALHLIVTTPLPDQISNEPYQGFYSVCLHRALSMLYRILNLVSQTQLPDDDGVLPKLESLAVLCLSFPTPQRIALFSWCLITNSKSMGLEDNRDEPLFPWAMKDLLSVHGFSFIDEIVAWLLHKADPVTNVSVPLLDLAPIRDMMPGYYNIA